MEGTYDIVVVGSGVAGLFFALSLPKEKRILVVTKDDVENSDSYLAQGGVCTLRNPSDFESYYEDTMRAGHYENSPESVRIMIQNSPKVIERLIEYGVNFDKNEDGTLHYTREGAHNENRILHHRDQTGKEITGTLIRQAKTKDNITILTYYTMIDLIEENGECRGIVLESRTGEKQAIYADAVALATGGMGGLFQHSTNFPHIAGDSFALAIQHGIELENLNYVQIHPTTLYTKRKERSFLISESVRGEGAILLNENGERFTDELQSRDIVAAAIQEEEKKFGTDHVYLTLVSMTSEQAQKRFPHIYAKCKEEGYDLATDPVPVTPAQHYLMGGIRANTYGETSMPRLYAVGETACNGVHGANRLASNSLLESLVFAERAAEKAAQLDHCEKTSQKIDLDGYVSDEERRENFRNTIMGEIKRKDEGFYDKWCKYED
ncbi:MAG: L-aspartate oxidase [Lachnospiraceae bacterium]